MAILYMITNYWNSQSFWCTIILWERRKALCLLKLFSVLYSFKGLHSSLYKEKIFQNFSVKLALRWHCVIDYIFYGAVIWSMGSNFEPDSRRCGVTSPVCGGGVTLVHLGVSDAAVWQWHGEKGAFTHTIFTKEPASLMMSFHHWKLSRVLAQIRMGYFATALSANILYS